MSEGRFPNFAFQYRCLLDPSFGRNSLNFNIFIYVFLPNYVKISKIMQNITVLCQMVKIMILKILKQFTILKAVLLIEVVNSFACGNILIFKHFKLQAISHLVICNDKAKYAFNYREQSKQASC